MSKESDLALLQGMREKILSIYDVLDRCKGTKNELEQLQAERDNNTRPALSLPRANKRSTLEKQFSDQWRESHENNKWVKVICVVVCCLLMAAYVCLFAMDIFRGTHFFENAQKLMNMDPDDIGAVQVVVFCLLWLPMPISIAIFPAVILLGDFDYQPLIVSGVIACAGGLLYVWVLKFEILYAFIPGVLMLISGLLIPAIRCAMAKHPRFNDRQKQQLAEAEREDDAITADHAAKNAQADREWADMRAKRLPEIEIEQNRLIAHLEQLRTELDYENNALCEMKGLGDDEKQLNIIDSLIYFIETCRADSIKEALHEYDKMVANQQLIELQRQRNALEERRIASEAADRQKQLKLMEQQEAARAIEARDSARARQEMIRAIRSVEWYHWAEYNGLNK
ncbi:MAG: hypothetical protein PUB05_06130 [Firmicutes bacterium]|nr:hypothetical protein [Bacillota bacterium]